MAEEENIIDDWVATAKDRIGDVIPEREGWNSGVNLDQAKHYNNGLGTVNPRYGATTIDDEVYPTYLGSVKYPWLHLYGQFEKDVPMSNVIGGVEYEWNQPIRVGMDLQGKTILKDVYEKERDGRRYVFLISEVPYTAGDKKIGTATGTMIYLSHEEGHLHEEDEEKSIYQYSKQEREEIKSEYENELQTMEAVPETPKFATLEIHDQLPTVVRGPLTIGDIAAWYAGQGIAYGATILQYRYVRDHPKTRTRNPRTNWVQKHSQQHVEPYLSEGRGMALPFASGIQTYSWSSLLVTNWMGRNGVLKRHSAKLVAPHYYGDTLWFDGHITDMDRSDGIPTVELSWEGVTQEDTTVVEGESTVTLPDQ